MVKIINKESFNKLINIIKKYHKNIIYGGNYDEEKLLIQPTIINVDLNVVVENDEVFGPILFLIKSDNNLMKNIEIANKIDNSPLAAYLFSSNHDEIDCFIKNINAGGYCINDPIAHLLNHNLPFGGIYTSGNGRYHGKYSYESMTFLKPVVINNSKIEPSIKFPNNNITLEKLKKSINFIKKITRYF